MSPVKASIGKVCIEFRRSMFLSPGEVLGTNNCPRELPALKLRAETEV